MVNILNLSPALLVINVQAIESSGKNCQIQTPFHMEWYLTWTLLTCQIPPLLSGIWLNFWNSKGFLWVESAVTLKKRSLFGISLWQCFASPANHRVIEPAQTQKVPIHILVSLADLTAAIKPIVNGHLNCKRKLFEVPETDVSYLNQTFRLHKVVVEVGCSMEKKAAQTCQV